MYCGKACQLIGHFYKRGDRIQEKKNLNKVFYMNLIYLVKDLTQSV